MLGLAQAAEVAGVKFAEQIDGPGNAKLVLNGAGLRKRFFLDIYAMGLYLPERLRKAEEVGAGELRAALAAHRYKINATAEALGVSRATLYRLIDESPHLRKAAELGRDEIEAALGSADGELEAAVELEVSLRGLKRRMRALGLDRS